MKVNEIRVVFPDGINIPEGYEPVADLRRAKHGDAVLVFSNPVCTERWTSALESMFPVVVLRHKWLAPERFRGSGLWLWEFRGLCVMSTDEPQWCEGHEKTLRCKGECVCEVNAIAAALGLTPDALPDWSNTPPAERKVQL